jgi:hypothetical protein
MIGAVAVGAFVAAVVLMAGWVRIWILGYRAGLKKGGDIVMDKMDEFVKKTDSITKASEFMKAWLAKQRPPRDEDMH